MYLFFFFFLLKNILPLLHISVYRLSIPPNTAFCKLPQFTTSSLLMNIWALSYLLLLEIILQQIHTHHLAHVHLLSQQISVPTPS